MVGHLPSWPVRDAERATVDRLRANARTPSTAQSTQQADLLSTTAASRPLAVEAQGPLHLPPRGAAPSDRAGTRQASVPEVGDRRPAHRCGGTSMTVGRRLEMRGAADASQRRRLQAVLHLSPRGAAPSDCVGTWQASAPLTLYLLPARVASIPRLRYTAIVSAAGTEPPSAPRPPVSGHPHRAQSQVGVRPKLGADRSAIVLLYRPRRLAQAR